MEEVEWVVEDYGGEPYEYVPLGKYIVRAKGVCGGRPTFKYTRVEVSGVLDRLALGHSIARISKAYGEHVPPAAVHEAITLANQQFVKTYVLSKEKSAIPHTSDFSLAKAV